MNLLFSRIPTQRAFTRIARPLTFSVQRNFGVINTIKSQITSGSVYRALGIVASIHILSTYLTSKIFDRALTLSVADYIENTFVKENQQFQIAGVVKPGTFQVKRGTLETRFSLTDFQNDVEIFYRGATKFEFKEGETMVITAYVPDIKNKNRIVGIDYLTKHSMDGTNWEDKIATSRQNFGINTRMQTMS